ncbi:protein translocase subunit SecD [Azospirillum sp. RWY-5-1]|uniref:Multifunctional fusion protein n=1 Tax=Azospirillum oleiclasticum TaxID=2735135 RepID=A0ABX2T264_9PROT|nr:protein translocase subunit SecD [Azospirillum oleiclasticum]NYZ11181.1 protein translocase subunit SecD [Azospirillum oleiclasticum]NYZ18343.1 protein translocase subunit SecD [Azospirillum oleiclasticum]
MRTPRWLLVTYALIILTGIVTALPNIIPQPTLAGLPDWFPKQRITLGLDLRGGSHLVLEVDAKELIRERAELLAADARQRLREADIAIQRIDAREHGITVVLRDMERRSDAARALQALAAPAGMGAPSDLAITSEGPGALAVTLTDGGIRSRVDAAVEQSLEIIRRRIDQVGVAEPTIQRVGADRILVQLPGLQDPSRIRGLLGSTAKLTFHMLASGDPGQLGRGVRLLPGADDGRQYPIENRIALAGERLSDASASFDQRTGEPIVSFRLDASGTRRFADITTQNVGKPFAIVLDGKVLSAPVIREPITGGSGQISGSFTVQQASDLAALLRAGALPAPLTVIEERTVGADLGGDAVRMGIVTGAVGFALVFGFMLLLYGRWGLLANVALALNVVLTLSALSLMGATLTLPGIAGIVLGIGLAVDANVLINERIREETRKGRSAFPALDAGFRRAYSTIIDSNVTALIATALLFLFGTGPVRGFAVTMGIGIAISMFTAVSIVRVVMTEIVRRRRLAVLRIEPPFGLKLIPDGTSIPFMRGRFAGIGVSALLSLASIGLFISPGLNYGVDFRGGIQMELSTAGPADLGALRDGLDRMGLGEIALQQFGGPSSVLIRAERQPGGEEAQSKAVERIRAELATIAPGSTIERTEVVGPKVSGELATAGMLSVVLASLAMLAYIWVRFDWPFAVGAIATLVLDVTKTVGFFALTGIDFNLTAIAALLTLIGYSVNDKVVVYDRMRENMRLYKSMGLRAMIDLSINETLARSLYTSITAFLALLPMAVWGGSAVESFAVPMVFGIVIAASSSVFIAAPILLFLGDWRARRRRATPAREEAAAQPS